MPVLNSKFFNRETVLVARELLGKFLVREIGKEVITLTINETEAYDGHEDKASHAYGAMTERNRIMFGQARHFYIYLIYGMHWMLNITTGPKDYPAAILIRGGFTTDGKNINGPGKVTKYLQVDKRFNSLPAFSKNGLWFEDRGIKISPDDILVGKRVGVDYAKEWAEKLYNFRLTL